MNTAMNKSPNSFYVTGGTLRRDAPSYVPRQADQDLYEGLRQGKFCYVLTSRQMGKSSLMVRTAARLREEGATVAILDLTRTGQNLTPEQWYDGLLGQLGEQLNLAEELEAFWLSHDRLGPLDRWMRAVREIVLPRRAGQIVIFVDEIDAVRSLPFSTDEFFAAIRECYNRRTEAPDLARLTFCLLGVATPSDLIRDTRTTPFNIGQRIELNDFTKDETAPLARGLGRDEATAAKLLSRILYWTGGHPYLTQKLCQAVAANPSVRSLSGLDGLCAELFFSARARERDDNLLFVRERLLRSETDTSDLLDLYSQVRRRKRVRDDESNPLPGVLRLSGITRASDGYLHLRNRIYEQVFDQEWVRANRPDADWQRQRAAYKRGLLQATLIATAVLAVIVSLTIWAFQQRQQAVKQKQITDEHDRKNRKVVYAAHLNLAQQAWEEMNAARALELLEGQRPIPGEEDLRGFEWYYLWRLSHNNLFTLPQGDNVDFIAYSPDGKTLAVVTDEKLVKLWDISTRQLLGTIQGHKDYVTSVAFSPDGKYLATGSFDKTAKLWAVATWQELATFSGHTGKIRFVTFSPNGKTLATSGADKTAKLWDVASHQELRTLEGHTRTVRFAVFSPGNKIVATGSDDRKIKLWNADDGRELATLDGHEGGVLCASFLPDGKTLATGGWDGTAKLWNISARREISKFEGHKGVIWSIAVSGDGRTLATASLDGSVRLWDLVTRQERTALRGHTAPVKSVVFSPDDKYIITGGDDQTVRQWDASKPGDPTGTLKGHTDRIFSVAFSRDGKMLATGSQDKTIKLWDSVAQQEIATLEGHTGSVYSVAFSPDGKTLASGSTDRTLKLWDIATKKELATLIGHTDGIYSVAFSPNGKILASGSQDRGVRLWDVAARQELTTLSGHKDKITSVVFSSDGKTLATGGWDFKVRLWDVLSRKELAVLDAHSDQVWALAFSPDGKTLATGSWDNTVKLWDVATRKERATIKGHAGVISALAFSPDGRRLATGSIDRTIKLWDLESAQELLTLRGQRSQVWSLAFSPDGKMLASTSEDRTVRLWYATTVSAENAMQP